MDSLSGGGMRLNDVTLVIRNVSVTRHAILIIFESMNVSSGVRACGVALDADTFAASDTHLICVIGSGEGLSWWADLLHTIRVIRSSNYQLTPGLSTYRYGYYDSRGWNRWSETTETTLDYGFAMSWQAQ
jgi:hypothetical protein